PPLSLHDALPISPLKRRLTAPSRALFTQPASAVRPAAVSSCNAASMINSPASWRAAHNNFELATPCVPTRRSVPSAKHRSSNKSEEHTSELQSRENLVCRLLLEKKK